MRRTNDPYDVLVIGGGLAGLTAAHHAALRGLRVASLDEAGHMGGLVMNVGRIGGYPAASAVSGIELAAAQLEAILELGVDVIPDRAAGLERDGGIVAVTTGSGVHKAKTVVLAMGARLKSLGVPGEKALFGRGVSQCADCDAGFFAGKNVVVAGGGDAALQEALHLSEYVSKITLVTRGETLRAKQHYVGLAADNPKFEFRWSTEISEILGEDGVEGVRLTPAGGGDAQELACSGVFVFVGLEPNVCAVPDDLARTADGYIVTDANFQTSLPGIYAVGAVRAGYSGQLASAAGEAAAAIAAIQTV